MKEPQPHDKPANSRNERPETSMRVTLSLGKDAYDRLDRLSRALSTYVPGGVSRSAVLRGLLEFAEEAALSVAETRLLMLNASINNPVGIPSPDFKPSADNRQPLVEEVKLWFDLKEKIFAQTKSAN
ncbi:hypothetical protein JIN84_08990 [Luteolibacter yonseiensis]|uniref:Uncharacterized protein n=1 Tax=Luteolibacter yonseiensis TaxID=1144680 RepID=A0A934VBB3_9BACT|nr:CopG family transcriptional regulator [Luteolibacter yonseiensis]MBK1815751.1 hypothetical protein [Luteolibacter yonseiensis]